VSAANAPAFAELQAAMLFYDNATVLHLVMAAPSSSPPPSPPPSGFGSVGGGDPAGVKSFHQ